MIDSVISKVDILSCTDLSSRIRNDIKLTKEILDWIGEYDSTHINKILYHSHDKELWTSRVFRKMILKNMSSSSLRRYADSEDAPAIAQGTMSNTMRADKLSRGDFNPSKGWGCRLLTDLGVEASNIGKTHKDTDKAIRQITVNKPMHKLKEFQKEVVESIVDKLSSDAREKRIVHLPTGAGKTRVTVEGLIDYASSNKSGLNVLWVADKRELCLQAEGTIEDVFSDFGLRGKTTPFEKMTLISYHSGKLDEAAIGSTLDDLDGIVIAVSTPDQVNIRMNKSMETAVWLQDKLDVLVVDEAHEAKEEYMRIFDRLPNSVDFLALTATPDSLLCSDVFHKDWLTPWHELDLENQDIEEQLERMNILSKKIEMTETIENFMLKSGRQEEFWQSTPLEQNSKSPFWYLAMRDLILSELQETNNPSILVFVDRIDQARRLSSMVSVELEKRGCSETCSAVWGEMHWKSRARTIRAFVERETEIVVNAQLLNHGFDAPLVNTVIIGRNTKPGTPLFKQMIGRGLRGKEFKGTKECRIIRLLP